MKKADLARRLAKRSRLSRVEAADQLDRVVNGIISRLKNGESAPLPGFGTFTPGRTWRFTVERSRRKGTHDKG